MLGVIYTCKVALLPFPAVFITAFSEVPAIYIPEASASILSNMVTILEKAQNNYKAVIIGNEPTMHTHNLNFEAKNAVAVCCSLKFQSVIEMNNFIENELKSL